MVYFELKRCCSNVAENRSEQPYPRCTGQTDERALAVGELPKRSNITAGRKGFQIIWLVDSMINMDCNIFIDFWAIHRFLQSMSPPTLGMIMCSAAQYLFRTFNLII